VAAKAPGEIGDPSHPHRELLTSGSSDSVWTGMSVTAVKPPSHTRATSRERGRTGLANRVLRVSQCAAWQFVRAGRVGRAQSISWQPD